ncbi:hypothetical protein Pmar_PMAR016458 [Perkinsus marinus ATCC 50983]|uniref:Uncharacterized protein n=1 Tax=Perkinsus marinus (strain ATCC 50983 / TXsc) TaxID=423536 RepID=C5L1B9_PERM5|nr:hypothetical protein Pmar_PMAR016458 [Perkinsus marinus ATCC 50983]EER09526.1 hypothetical protein Pmar_PMAR016458 [Perkinsus marinus ATCC 50983]|eukprot:XP_002777710.1 hypothetical protein Pmar_PMAR016458 [Perkinsus marinus ATCC 50983]
MGQGMVSTVKSVIEEEEEAEFLNKDLSRMAECDTFTIGEQFEISPQKHRESQAHQEQVLALTEAHLDYYQLFCDPSGYRRLYAMNHRTGELVFGQYFLREPQRLTEMAKALSLIHGEAKLPQGMIICKAVPNWFSHFEYYVKNATGRDKFEEWRTNKDKRLSSLQKIALRSQNGEMV